MELQVVNKTSDFAPYKHGCGSRAILRFVGFLNPYRRWVGPIVWEMEKYHVESRGREISYVPYMEGKVTGLVTYCVETSSWNTSWKKTEGRIKMVGRRERRHKLAAGWPWGKARVLGIERGSIRAHCLENSLLKWQWTWMNRRSLSREKCSLFWVFIFHWKCIL